MLSILIYQLVICNSMITSTQYRQPCIIMLIPLNDAIYTHGQQHHYGQEQPDAKMLFHLFTVAALAVLSPKAGVCKASVFKVVDTGTGLSGVNRGAPGPGFFVASKNAGT